MKACHTGKLSGPLNARLSLLQPLDCYWAPLCNRECDWDALSRPLSLLRTVRSFQLPRSKPLKRLIRAIVALSLGNSSLFTKFVFTIFVPLNPPPSNQQSDGFPLEFQ